MAKPVKEIQYAQSLLDRSRGMLTRLHTSGAPPQAILRKSTSNAYYAVFHCITNGGAKVLHAHTKSRVFSARAFFHNRIKDTFTKQLNDAILPEKSKKTYRQYFRAESLPFVVRLSNVFVELQMKRHQADYDFEVKYTKSDVINTLNDAQNAIKAYEDFYSQYPEDLKTMTSILLYEKISQVL